MRVDSTATSRSAAMGGMRDARMAGNTAATRVMAVPVPMAMATVVELTTMEVLGMSKPVTPSSERSPIDVATPRTMPTIEASTPTMTASAMTELRTCRRLAPMARNKASSRVRWARTMEKVL